MLLLPEGGAALQVVHQVVAGLESGAPVRGGGGDEDDGLAGFDPADAMGDAKVVEGKAGAGLIGDLLDLALGEAGIGLQLQHRGLALFGAGQAGEGGDRARIACRDSAGSAHAAAGSAAMLALAFEIG